MNTDTLQTVLGISKGVIVAVVDYVTHATIAPDFSFTSPTFLLGMVYAVIEGVKGFYGAGVKP